jgi:hypothetical protein
MMPQEIDKFKKDLEKETINKIIKKISVNDSYFYAEMIVMRDFDPMDLFIGDKIKIIIKMNLFNSKDFVMPNLINHRPKYLEAREIISEIIINSEDLIRCKEDAIMLIYEEVGKEIAKDLFQKNASEIQMSINETQKRSI